MITTSTGAKKIENTDNWREIFDAHNDSVDAEDKLAQDTAPIVNGNKSTTGASAGEYVLVRNSSITGITDGAYKAAKAIPANTAIDSTYLTAITGGIANDLNSKIDAFADSTILFQARQTSGEVTVPSLSQFRWVLFVLGWDVEAGARVNASSTNLIPMDIFKANKVRPQGDVYDGSTRHYARLQYVNDTTVAIYDVNNINGSWVMWAYGIK